jgi:hypothetical protein
MAKMSELQALLAAQKAELNTPLVDKQLSGLGAAMTDTKPLAAAGQALQQGKLDDAAKELEKLTPKAGGKDGAAAGAIDPRDARAAAAKMEKAAKEMQGKGLDKLGKATEQMSRGVRDADKQKLTSGAQSLAEEVRAQERRRRIHQLLAREEQRLSDCKSRCEKQNLLAQQRRQNGQEDQQQGQRPQPSPGQARAPRAGDATAQKPDEKDGRGTRQDLKGVASGDGPEEKEIIDGMADPNAPKADRSAQSDEARRAMYEKFRQLSEAALENEAIPLGHRQAIRRYFDLIRPPDAPAAPAEPAPPPPTKP